MFEKMIDSLTEAIYKRADIMENRNKKE